MFTITSDVSSNSNFQSMLLPCSPAWLVHWHSKKVHWPPFSSCGSTWSWTPLLHWLWPLRLQNQSCWLDLHTGNTSTSFPEKWSSTFWDRLFSSQSSSWPFFSEERLSLLKSIALHLAPSTMDWSVVTTVILPLKKASLLTKLKQHLRPRIQIS